MHTHTHVHIGADSPPGVTLRLCVHIASARVHCAASAPARETACEPIRSTAGAASVNAHETTASHITMVDTKRNALPRRDVGVRERALAPSLQFVIGQTHVLDNATTRGAASVGARACVPAKNCLDTVDRTSTARACASRFARRRCVRARATALRGRYGHHHDGHRRDCVCVCFCASVHVCLQSLTTTDIMMHISTQCVGADCVADDNCACVRVGQRARPRRCRHRRNAGSRFRRRQCVRACVRALQACTKRRARHGHVMMHMIDATRGSRRLRTCARVVASVHARDAAVRGHIIANPNERAALSLVDRPTQKGYQNC